MSDETELSRLQAQVVDLETQVAFQEETITALNGALALQQQDISELKRQWQVLQDRYKTMQEQLPGSDVQEKPPHY